MQSDGKQKKVLTGSKGENSCQMYETHPIKKAMRWTRWTFNHLYGRLLGHTIWRKRRTESRGRDFCFTRYASSVSHFCGFRPLQRFLFGFVCFVFGWVVVVLLLFPCFCFALAKSSHNQHSMLLSKHPKVDRLCFVLVRLCRKKKRARKKTLYRIDRLALRYVKKEA